VKASKKFAVAGAMTALLSIAGVSQAEATTYTGASCSAPCLSLYYNSNQQGSHASFQGYGKIDNLAGYTFASASAGQGQPVKNNAASAFFWAATTDETAVIYFNSNQGGSCDELWAQASKGVVANRLHNTYNNDASIKIFDGSQAAGICYQF
jgi:hypothetical protein